MNDSIVTQGVKVLNQGGIVIFPTDTAFGIGCRMDKTSAVKKLFAARKRPLNQPVPVLVNTIAMAGKYLDSPLPYNVRHMMEEYWPGALTVIYSCHKEKVPSTVRSGGKTLGVRMPNHKIPLTLINGIGVGLLGPSANFHGEKTPYKFQDLNQELVRLVDYVIPGECKENNVSTVVDFTEDPYMIIRQGALKLITK